MKETKRITQNNDSKILANELYVMDSSFTVSKIANYYKLTHGKKIFGDVGIFSLL